MTEEREPPPTPAARRAGALVLLGLVALTIGGAIGSFAFQVSTAPPPPRETVTVRGGTQVVAAVRELARIEAVTFHMERVVELTSTQRQVFGLVEAEDTILLVAAADIVGGVDLAELRDGDITVDLERGVAEILLPPPRVLGTRIDTEHTFVHSRQTDLLAERREELETEARREAERSLEQAAIEAGILDRSGQSAERAVEALVRSLGYRAVTVHCRPPQRD